MTKVAYISILNFTVYISKRYDKREHYDLVQYLDYQIS